MYIYYSQRDPRWAKTTFSPAKLTIGAKGCTITVASSMATWAGKKFTPDEMAKECKFTPNGLLLWRSLPVKFVWRYYRYLPTKAKEILLSAKGMCMIEVLWGRDRHWIGLVGWDRRGEIIHDPYDGKKKSLRNCPFRPTGFTELSK